MDLEIYISRYIIFRHKLENDDQIRNMRTSKTAMPPAKPLSFLLILASLMSVARAIVAT